MRFPFSLSPHPKKYMLHTFWEKLLPHKLLEGTCLCVFCWMTGMQMLNRFIILCVRAWNAERKSNKNYHTFLFNHFSVLQLLCVLLLFFTIHIITFRNCSSFTKRHDTTSDQNNQVGNPPAVRRYKNTRKSLRRYTSTNDGRGVCAPCPQRPPSSSNAGA